MRPKNSWPKILGILSTRPMTALQMSIDACLHPTTAAKVLRQMHKEHKVHISEWIRNRQGPPVPVYASGPGRNAKRLKPLTDAEKAAAHRARLSDAERTLSALNRRKPRRDIAASWI